MSKQKWNIDGPTPVETPDFHPIETYTARDLYAALAMHALISKGLTKTEVVVHAKDYARLMVEE